MNGKIMASCLGAGILVLLLGVLALTSLTVESIYDYAPAWAPSNQAIAFVCYKPKLIEWLAALVSRDYWGDSPYSPKYAEICTMTNDGKERKQLTNNRAQDYAPQWSPENQQIAFISNRAGDPALYLMAADGSNQHEISGTEGVVDFAWSHKEERIAFSVYPNRAKYGVYLMTTKTEAIEPLKLDTLPIQHPTWSPDDKTVAFLSGTWPDECELHLVGLDLHQELMPPVAASCSTAAAWSPSGTRLAYVGQRGEGLLVLDLAQEHVVTLDRGLNFVSELVWLSENKVGGSAGGEIFINTIDNGQTQYLTHFSDQLGASGLALSGDGKYFAIARYTETAATIWRLNIDGSGLVRLNP